MFYPDGLGLFGLPAENASKLNNLHPKSWTKKILKQWKNNYNHLVFNWLGLRNLTCDEDYYKHQQELFIDFYNQGLVSRKETTLIGIPKKKQY